MSQIRRIRKVFKSKPTLEGAGVHLKRVFGFSEVPEFDPFLLLDEFHSSNPDDYALGFPWHPHRGIETITYMLEGEIAHSDSLGNSGVIHAGDVQWMTAGSGIVHQEMPEGDTSGAMWGFQLWANLPAAHKMKNPRYREVRSADIPEVRLGPDAKIRTISGEVSGVNGPVRDVVIEPLYLDITVPPGSELKYPVTAGHTVFAYVIDGQGCFCQERDPFAYEVAGANYFDIDRDPLMRAGTLALFGEGDRVVISTEDEPIRFLLISGKPINEPVAWYGPIVMNTREELRVAFDEYRHGRFIKV